MEATEIVEGNRLIAVFLGATILPDQGSEKITHYVIKGKHLIDPIMDYHTNWNHLMPVVDKIEEINNGEYYFEIVTGVCRVYTIDERGMVETDIIHGSLELNSKIESVWHCVVDFIQWYNSQPEILTPDENR